MTTLTDAEAVGSSQGKRSERESKVLRWLKDGAVPFTKIADLAKDAGISRTVLFEIKKALSIQTLSSEEGDLWVLLVDVKLNPNFANVEEEPKATAEELAKIASTYRRFHDDAGKCLDVMMQFAEESPAEPPVSIEEIFAIYFHYFPLKTKEQVAEENEIARVVEMLEGEFILWEQKFRKAHRRPATEEEIAEHRLEQEKIANQELAKIRIALNDLEAREVPLTVADIDALPDVADFISRHAADYPTAEFPVVARAQTMLNRIRESHAEDTRKATLGDFQGERAALEARIVQIQKELKETQKYVPPFVSTMTNKDRAFLAKVRTARQQREDENRKPS